MAHREVKDRIYPLFARVAQAMASNKRLELVDLLAQSPRHVDALAHQTGMSVANVSQHLQVLRSAHLVVAERRGNMTVYRLSGTDVLKLWLSVRQTAESHLAEVKEIARSLPGRENGHVVSRDEAESLVRGGAILLDVRPRPEFETGHLAGATNIPLDELAERLHDLPSGAHIITYCRGEYCLFADEAAALLRSHGFDVLRLEGGWPEWFAEGRPTAAVGSR